MARPRALVITRGGMRLRVRTNALALGFEPARDREMFALMLTGDESRAIAARLLGVSAERLRLAIAALKITPAAKHAARAITLPARPAGGR